MLASSAKATPSPRPRGSRRAAWRPSCDLSSELPAVLRRRARRVEIGAIACPFNPTYTEREMQDALVTTGATTLVVLNRFYEKVKHLQAATSVQRMIVTNIKEYLPFFLSIAFTLFKEKKRETGSASRREIFAWLISARVSRQASAERRRFTTRHRRRPDERRNDRKAEGRRRFARRNGCRGTPAQGVAQSRHARMGRHHSPSASTLSHVRKHGRPESFSS